MQTLFSTFCIIWLFSGIGITTVWAESK